MIFAIALATSLMFPSIQARDLNGQTIQTQQQRGTPVAYLIGFTHESRTEAQAWKKTIETATGGSLRAIEMPVLSGMAVMMRPVIESSMTRKTPEADRANIQVTTDRDALIKGLAVADPDRAAVVTLVSASGEVLFTARGGVTPENEAAFLASWQALTKTK